jgi:hypothetical protein
VKRCRAQSEHWEALNEVSQFAQGGRFHRAVDIWKLNFRKSKCARLTLRSPVAHTRTSTAGYRRRKKLFLTWACFRTYTLVFGLVDNLFIEVVNTGAKKIKKVLTTSDIWI